MEIMDSVAVNNKSTVLRVEMINDLATLSMLDVLLVHSSVSRFSSLVNIVTHWPINCVIELIVFTVDNGEPCFIIMSKMMTSTQ